MQVQSLMIRELSFGPRLGDNDESTIRHALTLAPAGHAVEFGVATGRTIRIIRDHLPVTGFDSFEGLPEDWRPDFPAGCFACPAPDVPGVELVIGLFEETLPRWTPPAPISFVHIDCDLYSSTATAFAHIDRHLTPGCIIVFDEFHGYTGAEHHEQRAWEEYIDRTGHRFDVIGHGREQYAVKLTG